MIQLEILSAIYGPPLTDYRAAACLEPKGRGYVYRSAKLCQILKRNSLPSVWFVGVEVAESVIAVIVEKGNESLIAEKLPHRQNFPIFQLFPCLLQSPHGVLLTHPVLFPACLRPQLDFSACSARQFLHKINEATELQRLIARVIVRVGLLQQKWPDIHRPLFWHLHWEKSGTRVRRRSDDWNIVIDYDILPHALLVYSQKVYSERTDTLTLEDFLQQLGTPRETVHRRNQILLRVTVLPPCNFHPLGSNESEASSLEQVRHSHPRNIIAKLFPTLLCSKYRGRHRGKDFISVFASTRYGLPRLRLIGRCRKSVSSCGASVRLSLKPSNNRLIFLLYDLVCAILCLLPLGPAPARCHRTRTRSLFWSYQTAIEDRSTIL